MKKAVLMMTMALGLWGPAHADMDILPLENAVSTTYVADSPAAAELLTEARRLFREEQDEATVETLQQIVKDYGGRLLEDESGRFVDARDQAWTMLLSSPKLIEEYERRYGSLARQQLQRAIRPTIDEQALANVSQRFAMTRAGLEAILHRAALQLQRGNFDHANLLLEFAEQHPSLSRQVNKLRLSEMQAFIAAARGETDLQPYMDQYRLAGGQDTVELQSALKDVQSRALAIRQAVDELWPRDQAAPSLSRPSWQLSVPLWKNHGDAEQNDADDRFGQQRILIPGVLVQAGDDQPVAAVTVTPFEQTLLVQNALGLTAWDRSSGRPLWSRLQELPSRFSRMRSSQFQQHIQSLASEAPLAEAGVVYALTDWSGGSFRHMSSGFDSLRAFEIQTGRELWQTHPQDIDPSLSTAKFHGRPIKQSERLFAMMSRTQTGGFQELYLVALDPRDGEALWHRHIASSSLAGMAIFLRDPEFLLNGRGRIYVSNGRGVVASVSAMDGGLLWAQLFEVDTVPFRQNRARFFGQRQSVENHALADLKPVLIDSGLIVPVQWRTDSQPLMRLDASDGTVIDEQLPIGEGEVLAMQGLGEDLLILQNEQGLTRYDGATLEQRWRIPLDDVTHQSSLVSLGHVAAVATSKEVLMIDLEDGSILQRRTLTKPAALSLSPGQVVMVQGDAISSFMVWEFALQQLSDQMAARPADPNPGLALARMAFNEGQLSYVNKGMDHAVASLSMNDPVQRGELLDRVFADLIELGRDTSLTQETAMADAVYRRLGEIINSPGQRVVWLMDHGEHLARVDRLVEAVASYQEILLTEELADQTIRADQLVRPAGLMAHQRLEKLIADHGRTIYDRFETEAVGALLRAREAGDLDQLVRVADRYPVSNAAVEALASAGDLLVERGELAMASEYYRQAIRLEPQQSMVRSLASRMITVYEQAGQTRQASYWLRRLDRQYPGLVLTRDDSETTAKQWLASLAETQPMTDIPVVTLPLRAATNVAGELLKPWITSERQTVQPGFLVRESDTLHYHRGVDGHRLWSIERPGAQLLLIDEAQILLYSPQQDAIEGLNPGTGRELWPAVRVDESLEAVAPLGGQADQDDQRRAFQIRERIEINREDGGFVRVDREIDPSENMDLVFASGPLNLAVADRMGRVMLLDRMSGEVRWRKATSVHLPLALAMSDDQVAVAGSVDLGAVRRWRDVRGGVGQLQLIDGEGGVVILDLEGGEEQMAARQRSAPFFAKFHASGDLITVASQDIFNYATQEHRIQWHHDSQSNLLGPAAWLDGDFLLAMERQGSMSLFDINEGRWIRRVSLQAQGRISLAGIEVAVLDHDWVLSLPERLLMMDMGGQVIWKDGSHRDKDTRVAAMLVSATHVFAMQLQQDVGDKSSFMGMILNLENGLIESTFEIPITPRLNIDAQGFAQPHDVHAMFVENGLVFAAGDRTLFYRGSKPKP